MPLIFDAQGIVTRHFADFVRAHTILSRSIPQSGKFFRRNGNHHARPALAEERVLRGNVFRHRHTRSEPRGREARFRQRHRHAAVAHVMRRLQRPCFGQGHQTIDHPFLRGKFDRRRFPGHNPANRLGIFAGGELPLFPGPRRSLVRRLGRRGSVEQHDHIPFLPERHLQNLRRILQNPQHPNHRRRINRFPQRLVIKTDVSRR